MSKLLFITYGEPGWRGVQMRAVRIASYFPKEEVLFWNIYDSEFIKTKGFSVETKPAAITWTNSIIFPEEITTVIFSDLPSNEFFEYAVFMAAIRDKKKIVICEQIYRKNQLDEGVFNKFVRYSDLFLVNSVSYFSSEEKGNIKIVPPQIEIELSDKTRIEEREKYGVPKDATLILGIGYHKKVFEKIKEIAERLEKDKNVYVVIIGESILKPTKIRNCTLLPYMAGDEYFKLLKASDLVLVKFGLLQILEGLALQKPLVVLGESGWVLNQPNVLDEPLSSALKFDPEISEETYSYIDKFLYNQAFRNEILQKVKNLHNGELFGAKKAADYISGLQAKPTLDKVMPAKKLAILVNEEIFERKDWLLGQEDIYPLCFLLAMPVDNQKEVKRFPQSLLQKTIKELQLARPLEILPHSFMNLQLFSQRKADGLIDILPWYDDWIRQIESLIASTDTVYTGSLGEMLFSDFFSKHKNKIQPLPSL